MKKLLKSVFLVSIIFFLSCSSEDEVSERFKLLTSPTWESVDLLVDGEDASGEGQLLEKFKGDAKFYEDGTGYFGEYQGTWGFANKETELVIYTPELGFYLTTIIDELTSASLKISTEFPVIANPGETLSINMTFRVK